MPEPATRPTRSLRLRLSVRALMLIVLIVGGGLGWYFARVRRQAEAVEYLRREVGGWVQYDWEYRDGVATPWPAKSPWPDWMMRWFGPDFLSSVTSVTFQKRPSSCPDEVLRRLRALPRLERVFLDQVNTDELTNDADLALICQLDRLKTLEIGCNKITNEGLSALKNLGRLEELNAEWVLTDRSGFAHFATLKSLKKLQINSSELDDDGLAPLEALTNLRELDLNNRPGINGPRPRNDKITSEGLVHLSKLQRLERLSLCDARITHLDPLGDLKSLRKLRLTRTDVNDQALAVIGRFSKLEILSLGWTKVTDSRSAELTRLSKLRLLRLDGTEIGDPTVVHLGQLANLEQVDLMHTRITVNELGRLAHFQLIRLDSLHSREAWKALQLRLPGVRLEHYNTGMQDLF